MEEQVETIITRFMRLNHLLLGKSNYSIPKKYLVHRDALLDVLFALYEECNVDYLKKNKNINAFVDKFKILMPELKNLRVNLKDFEVKKVIGRGHFGTVNVVREKATGDVYAMKVLCKQETLSQQNVAFYEEERDIMVKSSSQWITKLQYAFQDNQNLYLVMEFHPGGDMVSLLQKYDYILPEDMCKFYLAELVLAINSVHAIGYVHRDIKPDNILIDRTGHIKLADFGSAAKLNIHLQVTSSMPVGTPDYIAPEVLTAMNAIPTSSISYGVECDWWSLGVVAYEMVYGSTPFASDKVLFTYNNIMNFKNFFKLPPESIEVSESLNDLIKNLLQESATRFKYEQLTTHKLFLDIDWNNIRNIVPPYIPTVTSVDDTSNFDDFEPENRPTFSDLKCRKEFSARNLPFVGFTFTPQYENFSEKSSLQEDSYHTISTETTETDSISKNRVLNELQKELCHHSEVECSLRSEIKKLKDCLLIKEKEISIIKDGKSLTLELNAEIQAEVKEMKELLTYEREHRLITEKKATHLIKCMKQKQKQDAILLKTKSQEYHQGEKEVSSLESQLAEFQLRFDELTKEKADLLSDLYDTKHVLLECQKKLSEKEQDLLASELNSSMSSALSNSSEFSNSLQRQSPLIEKKLVKKLERKNVQLEQELETALNLRYEAESKVSNLEKIIEELSSTDISSDFTDKSVYTSASEEIKISQKGNVEAVELNKLYIAELEDKLQTEEKIKAEYQIKLKNSETEFNKQQNDLKNMEEKLKILEEELSALNKQVPAEEKKENEPNLDNKSCPWVRKSFSRIERQERLLLSDLKHENKCLKTKVESLTSEVTDLKQNIKNKENAFAKLEEQLAEKNSALSDAKLELGVSTRKEHLTDTLRERNKELREQLKEKESAILEKLKLEDDLRAQLKTLESEISIFKKEIQEKEKIFDIEKARYEERLRTLKDTCEDSKDVTQKYAKSQGQYEEIIRQNTNLTKECEEKTKKVVQLNEEIKSLKSDISKKQSENSKYQKIISTLKQACIDMENDLNDFETLVEARDAKIEKLTKERDTFLSDTGKCKEELKILRCCLDEKENQREELLRHVQELTAEIENQASLHETELQMLQDQLNHYKKGIDELEKKAGELQRDVSFRGRDTANYSKKVLDLESQLCIIKEEAASHITQISSLKASNSKLTLSLEEALKKLEESEKNINELHNERKSEKVKYDHEKVKLQETISQQTKLIDFLQTKAESMEKKKKPISRLFGKKEPPSPIIQSRDVEKLLETERGRCRRLQDQLSQARAEKMILQREISNLTESLSAKAEAPATPNSRALHTAITYSPSSKSGSNNSLVDSSETLDKIIKPPGMKHKIPHRFSDIMCMRNTKCCICLDSMYLGRSIVKCQECLLECHPKCASSLPKTCGLPSGFMQHFKSAVKNSASDEKSLSVENVSEGWIKVPKNNKHGWDRRYMHLKEDTLYVFESSDEKDPEDALLEFEFKSDKAIVTVTSAVSATELPYAASSDLPFVLKVESFPNTTCWPKRCLYIMTSNFSEKQMWVSILEKAAELNFMEIDSNHKKLDAKTVICLKGSKAIDPLCSSIFDENVILLGATEGLFVLSNTNEDHFSLFKKIDELPCIFQISCMKSADVVALISGEDRQLSWIDLNSFRSRIFESSTSKLSLKSISNEKNCHLFAVGDNTNIDGSFICCATSQTIIIYQYDSVLKLFHSKKIISVNEPCSCILFTKHSIIFGTDVFYELDLTDFSAKGFLDGSDASLAGLVYGAPQFRSFPVAIFDVGKIGINNEYILCFHEMGVFVNSQGRKTRSEDMKWSRLPLSFAYRSPYLFIIHFNSVEVVELPTQTSVILNRAVIPVQNAQYMGWIQASKSILISSKKQNASTELIVVDGAQLGNSDYEAPANDYSSSTSSSPKKNYVNSIPDSEDLDFSFSSTIDQNGDTFSNQTRISEESSEN